MPEIGLIRKPIFWLGLILVLVLAAIWQLPDNNLHLVFCNVGQGDAALITYKSEQILVDGGPDDRVLSCLGKHMPFWDQKIEVIIATHPDADHLTGLINVIKRYNVKYFIINSIGKDSAVFEEFKKTVLAEQKTGQSRVYFPVRGDQLKIGRLAMIFLWPENQERVLGATTIEKKTNETSVVFELFYGRFAALFPADISSQIESQLELTEVTVLKVAHHGSKYSTSQEFLEKIKPKLGIISVGKNRFGHPTQAVLDRLKNQKIKTLRTDQAGEIEIISDGQSWQVLTKKGL